MNNNLIFKFIFVSLSFLTLVYGFMHYRNSLIVNQFLLADDLKSIEKLKKINLGYNVHHGLTKGRMNYLYFDEIIANRYFAHEQLDSAFVYYDSLINISPNRPEVITKILILSSLLNKDVDKYFNEALRLLKRFPYNRELNLAIANTRFRGNNICQALAQLKEGLIGRESIFYTYLERLCFFQIKELKNTLSESNLEKRITTYFVLQEISKVDIKEEKHLRSLLNANEADILYKFDDSELREYKEWLKYGLLSELLPFIKSIDDLEEVDVERLLETIWNNYFDQLVCKRTKCDQMEIYKLSLLDYMSSNFNIETYKLMRWRSYQTFKY